MTDPRSDEALLAAARSEPEAFATFYRNHVRALISYFLRRTRDPEIAADLTAETFAAALDGCHRFRPERGPAVGWLYGIARRQLAHAHRRGAVEDRARRRLGMAPLSLDDTAALSAALSALPPDQRDAVRSRLLDEREYADIALSLRTSESVVRKRVSRGLAGLRSRLEGKGT
jgi:RNA polymerase sigma factor (sigma-70 family)